MAHGAPDHTRLSDDAYAHYETIHEKVTIYAVPIAETIFRDLFFTGVFGYLIVNFRDPRCRIKIYIDGNVTEIHNYTLEDMWKYTGKASEMVNGVCGISKYDAINNYYTMWIDYKWSLYVHTECKITFQSTGGGAHSINFLHWIYKRKT